MRVINNALGIVPSGQDNPKHRTWTATTLVSSPAATSPGAALTARPKGAGQGPERQNDRTEPVHLSCELLQPLPLFSAAICPDTQSTPLRALVHASAGQWTTLYYHGPGLPAALTCCRDEAHHKRDPSAVASNLHMQHEMARHKKHSQRIVATCREGKE
jgi:hypothetical protein